MMSNAIAVASTSFGLGTDNQMYHKYWNDSASVGLWSNCPLKGRVCVVIGPQLLKPAFFIYAKANNLTP